MPMSFLQTRSRSYLGWLLAALISILLFNSWFLYLNFQKVSEQQNWLSHSMEVLSEVDQMMSAAKDAETGTRGFLLTGVEAHLDPYRSGTTEAYQHLNRAKFLTQDNNEQQGNLMAIERTLKQRFEILDSVIARYRAGKFVIESSRAGQLGEGKVVMDNLRTLVANMNRIERDLMSERATRTERSRYYFLIALFVTAGLGIVIVSASTYQTGRNQIRASLEAAAKAKEAWETDLVAGAAQIVTGEMAPETAGAEVLRYLVDRLGVVAGRLSIWDQGKLRDLATIGTDAGPRGDSKLPNEAFHRGTPWTVTDVPAEYWRIGSSLGSAKPSTLVFLPMSFQGNRFGLIEMASFGSFENEHEHVLPRLSETIGIGINAAISRGHLQAFLEKTQQQSEELQAQQEELRASNEELEQQARALESQQQALNVKNQEIEASKAVIEIKAADLERASQYKSEFLAKMSHELRTPLNGLLILSTLLIENKEKNLTEQQRQFARSIYSAGNDLLMLINDILDLSKIEARKLVLKPERFLLRSVFENQRRTFEPQTQAKGLELVTDLAPELQTMELYSDRQRLEQVLRNFISNAVKFTEKGSVKLEAKAVDDGFVELTVIDTGIGVPKGKQQSIFEAFEQADVSISQKYGGTGLGLTISRELAHLLGGTISLKSQEETGSRFTIRIPLRLPEPAKNGHDDDASVADLVRPTKPSAAAVQRHETIAQRSIAGLSGDRRSILVVEDDEKFRSSVVEAIRSYGFDPVEAGDGDVALAILNAHTPDAILLDIKLPGISGLGLLEMIKQMPHLRHVPVHIISALDYQHNALRMGALGYMTKPVSLEKVRSALDRIENLLSQKVRRVLLIEDDETQNKATSRLIEGEDLEVVSARTGRDTIEYLTVKRMSFDCIILDLTLPDISGFDLLSKLASLDIALPPIVIYTGKDLTDEEEKFLRKYSESIIIKGARSPERLLDEVNLFLHRVESALPDDKRELLTQLRSQETNFDGKTVLVVDDDIRNVFALTSALESKGMLVRVARNGVEALDALNKHPEIDLVFMDIMMPKMDGFEAIRRIRDLPSERARTIPVVALTAKAMKEDHEKCMEAGANDYLSKPVNMDNLTTILKVWLTRKGIVS